MKCAQLSKIIVFCFVLFLHNFSFAQSADQLQLDKLRKAISSIEAFYVDSVDMEKLVEDAIIGALDELDPHSIYMSAEEIHKANESLSGSFYGIGIQFNILNDTIIVVSPISGGPSEKVGIMAGDKIVQVNGEEATGKDINTQWVLDHLKGDKGTKVMVSIMRQGETFPIDFEITRGKIPIYSMDAAFMLDDKTGYIKINRFAATTMSELLDAMSDLKDQEMTQLVLDLRGNSGGYLSTAIHMVDQFLESGKTIVYTEGLYSPKNESKSSFRGGWKHGKLVVLIDEGSASASEIVSGAIQDWDRGLIIGRRSFGKGLVQRPMDLPDGSVIRLTIARYYTPSGRCIQKSYENGQDEYADDLAERYKHGELYHKDSIHLDSDEIYYTAAKRKVYGGGGIMPDIFVPLDTTFNSKYYTNLFRKGVINRFTLSYIDLHRDQLNKDFPTLQVFKAEFDTDQDFMGELVAFAQQNEVPMDEEGYKKSEVMIKSQLKALIARNLFGISAYYECISDKDNAIQKALEVLNNTTFDELKIHY